jgi:hypothetical protein
MERRERDSLCMERSAAALKCELVNNAVSDLSVAATYIRCS